MVIKDREIANPGRRQTVALRADRRSFDCASCDETARGSAQDDNFYMNQALIQFFYPAKHSDRPLRLKLQGDTLGLRLRAEDFEEEEAGSDDDATVGYVEVGPVVMDDA